jgi:dihydrolipoyl dehydrogenase
VMLAHKASAEGETAALGATGSPCPVPYEIIPSVMYTKPEVARAGLLEASAREKYGDILVGRFPFAANGRALLEGSTQGFVKVIAEAENECIVGVSMIGPDAGHLIGEAALAVEMEATLSDLEDTVHAHPTLSEALREAALDAKGNAIHIPPA